ncbi:glycosyltransferase [Lactobacillus delbrueckii subsp. bulgaricus]|nr:glycosyltransferase [Lactobacillus delbrueckii subsp. bulgaricus]MBT8875948.1 glycosyltransferase [Lactobacillus delbrueckii subsp. bulgaricus]MBT8877635.1 glycosyltransferase [Lactobacillus delbrueckii subsp. bulgaricus]MBT9021806.1 glycosyltransferase [Lactobacillus delbrueckii subsp. bulgaricus]
MIFVTVGTHEQPFNRLIEKMDELVEKGEIKEKVVVQYGFSTYEAKHCEMHEMMSFDEMQQTFKDARIVITHGGPSSFVEALQYGKVPIVVPRQLEFNEHVNNHQVDFTKLIAERMNNIIPVCDIANLGRTIADYDTIVKKKNSGESSNNKKFNADLDKIVDEMMEG